MKLNGTNSNRLDWGIRNGTLSVHLRPGGEKGASGDVKTIYYDTLSSLKISASNVSVQGTLTQGMIDVDMTAGAIFGADLQLKDICLKITGNSVANLTGSAKYGTLIATSKSKVNARPLTCQDVRVEATSGAEAYVKAVTNASRSSANTGGAMSIDQGEPEIFRSATKMMGTVINIGG
ncbi:MAG: GIN domain-containing protein [Alistipes indistinctus]